MQITALQQFHFHSMLHMRLVYGGGTVAKGASSIHPLHLSRKTVSWPLPDIWKGTTSDTKNTILKQFKVLLVSTLFLFYDN
jgi:hypothetical protein